MENGFLKRLSDSESLTDVLVQMEDFLDNLDLYAFRNWFDGEIIEGPYIEKYWVSMALQYEYKDMPDPRGGLRLLKHGVLVKYTQKLIDDLEDHHKITTDEINREIGFQASYDDPSLGSTLQKANDKKLPKKKVWIIEIKIPRHLIDELDDCDLDLYQNLDHKIGDKPKDLEESAATVFEGLAVSDLENLVEPIVSIDEYESKLDDTAIVISFRVSYRDPARDLNRFLQKSDVDILDTEISPAPTEDGFYMVFVELSRDNGFYNKLKEILNSLRDLTNIHKWECKIYKHSKLYPIKEEIINNLVDLLPKRNN